MSDIIHSSPSVAGSISLNSEISQDFDTSSMLHKSSSAKSDSSITSDILSEILVLPQPNKEAKKEASTYK